MITTTTTTTTTTIIIIAITIIIIIIISASGEWHCMRRTVWRRKMEASVLPESWRKARKERERMEGGREESDNGCSKGEKTQREEKKI